MTPYRYSPGTFVGARVATVLEECGIGFSYVDISMGIRPSVALISTIKILSGNGISSDPFVID